MIKYLIKLVILFIIFISPEFKTSLQAQNNKIRFEHITIEQGLSQQMVNSIIQDDRGFMWFATEFGLNCYNGYDFNIYRSLYPDSTTLSSNTITVIFKDRFGTLWIGTDNGLNKFNRSNESFIRYLYDPKNPVSLSDNFITAIAEDHSGNLWIATKYGLNLFNREKEVFLHCLTNPNDPNSLSNHVLSALHVDKNNNLWIGTFNTGVDLLPASYISLLKGNSLNTTLQENVKFFHFKNYRQNPYSISNNYIRTIQGDRFGNIWIGTMGGLNRISFTERFFDIYYETSIKNLKFIRYKNNPKDPYSISGDDIRSILEDKFGNMWIGTYGDGLNKYNSNKEQFIRYKNDPNDSKSLNSNHILSIYEDRANNIWLGTYSGGVNKFNLLKNKIKLYEFNAPEYSKIGSKLVWSVFKDSDGFLWVGLIKGLLKVDEKLHKYSYYENKPNVSNCLSHNTVRSICEDKFGHLWFGTQGGGLNMYDKKKNKFIIFKNDKNNFNSLSENTNRALLTDKSGSLWIGTYMGLDNLDINTGIFKHYRNDPQDSNSLSHNHIWSLFEDRKGNLWVGTRYGLNKFDRTTGKFIRYIDPQKEPNMMGNNLIVTICEDNSGTIWVGTLGGGLHKLISIESLTSKPGQNVYDSQMHLVHHPLPKIDEEMIYGLVSDPKGNLWFSSKTGIWKFNPLTDFLKNYDISDGLQGKEFITGSFFQSKNEEIFFGGNSGLNSLSPFELIDNNHIPAIVITSFNKYERPVITGLAADLIKEINLSYFENFFSFEFAALDFSNPSRNQYAYKLEGFDNDWIQCGSRRYASYTNLNGGEYIFRLKGSNSDLIWNSEGISLKIVINPPFWATLWFKIIIVIFIISVSLTYHQLRLRNLRNQTIKLNTTVEERTHELNTLNEDLYKVNDAKNNLVKELEKTNKDLQDANKLKNEFLNIAAHDLKSPLANVFTYAEVLKTRTAKQPEIFEFSDVISKSTQRMFNLIDDLLEASKVEAIVELKAESLNFSDLVLSVVRNISPEAERKEQKIIHSIIKSYIIKGNYTLLQVAVRNLLSNAIKFSPINKQIRISLKNDAEKVYLEVSDDGPGLKMNEKEKIFEKFQKLSARPTADESSTGLGLSIVKKIVELHEGRVWVESEFGKGSTFIVEFPDSKEIK